MKEKDDDFQFIDAESDVSGGEGTTSYETIVLRQISHCVNVLSKEEVGGYVETTAKGTQRYVADIREEIINSVDTLRMLIKPFILSGKEDENVKKLINDAEDYKLKLKEKYPKIFNTPAVRSEYVRYKSLLYREMFSVLLIIFNRERAEIAKMSYE